MLIAALIAVGLAQVTAKSPALDIEARLVVQHKRSQIDFIITNASNVPINFDEAMSPCAPSELVTVVYVGEGSVGRFIERNPMISDSFSRNRTLKPHQSYQCSFDISHWFYGKLPSDKSTILFWSFRPSGTHVFRKSLYGGAFLLHQ